MLVILQKLEYLLLGQNVCSHCCELQNFYIIPLSFLHFLFPTSSNFTKLYAAYCYEAISPSACMHKTLAGDGKTDQKTRIHQMV